MKVSFKYFIISGFVVCLLAACTTTKYVPDGAYLLDEVQITTDNKDLKPSALHLYLRQNANAKWFNLFKMQLYIYNLSGRDSTRWINKVMRRLGDAPVIYNENDTRITTDEITKSVRNYGYLGATVSSARQAKGKKLKLTYHVKTGRPYQIKSLHHDLPDSTIAAIVKADSTTSLLRVGMMCDINLLDAERQRITRTLQNQGYYKFNKEYITYTADTINGTCLVDLTLHLQPYKSNDALDLHHKQYYLNSVNFITDYNVLQSSSLSSIEVNDSIHYQGIPIFYKDRLYLRPKVLVNNLNFRPGALYNDRDVQRTYSNFGRLQALKYTNIRFFEVEQNDSVKLNAYVLLTRSKHQSVSLELEGTNSAGDLGAAASVTFQHRNIFHGSEALMLKFRGAYESVSGLKTNAKNQSYTEWGAEASINFPRFMFPLLSNDFKRKIRATSEFSLQYNYQMRPEFTRIVSSAGWSYNWGLQGQRAHHRLDLIDVNYLYMPWIDAGFKELYLNQAQNYILKYNYDDRLIVRTGYTYTYNSAGRDLVNSATSSDTYSLRCNIETAGNLLYAFGRWGAMRKNDNQEYTFLNIPFAQYLKLDGDFARNIRIDHRNSVSFHLGGGVAIPYGNADMLPFEKRYFAGGANSVRGWSVRELGPGTFGRGNGNFMNQSGDIKIDASVEYRTRLFWKFRGAVFVDAGNIWTLRDYKDQPGGQFKFSEFYKQFAVAYGLGVRLDLDFFVLRFDGGMKAVNPLDNGMGRYPLVRPDFRRDFALHFAVGYPF